MEAQTQINSQILSQLQEMTRSQSEIFRVIGGLEEMSIERRNQTSELFRLFRHHTEQMATKEDVQGVQDFVETHINNETARCNNVHATLHTLDRRVSAIEQDKSRSRKQVAFWFGFPVSLAAFFAIWDFIVTHLLHRPPTP